VTVGTQHAGDYVSAFLYSTPVNMGGWIKVDGSNKIEVTIPAGTAPGVHRLAVQDATGAVIGWTSLTVSATSGSGLASTGTELAPALTMAALLLMLGGALVVSRRRRTANEG
jgi:5'-nucleotidase